MRYISSKGVLPSFVIITLLMSGIFSTGMATSSCGCGPCEGDVEIVEIDPTSDDYQALVWACMADDKNCEALCIKLIPLIEQVFGEAPYQKEDISVCKILNREATKILIEFYNECPAE